MEALDRWHLYGCRNWGDFMNGNPAMIGPLAVAYSDDPNLRIADRIGWMNIESHDSVVGACLQFLRTGDPRLFYIAEAATEHAAVFYRTLRHYDGGLVPSHAMTSGILLGYYLIDDRMLRDVAIAAADYWMSEQKRRRSRRSSGRRRKDACPTKCPWC